MEKKEIFISDTLCDGWMTGLILQKKAHTDTSRVTSSRNLASSSGSVIFFLCVCFFREVFFCKMGGLDESTSEL
jgi:hypothetical protein